jgi:O-antigen/teichoic acid export membrane protein
MQVTARSQTLLVAVGQVTGSLVGLVTVAWLARVMPATELGKYLYFVAAAAAIEGLSDLGLRLHGVAKLSAADSSGRRLDILNALWRLKLALSAITTLVLLAATAIGWIQYADSYTALVLSLVAVTLPSSSPAVWDVRARGMQWLEAALLVVYRLLMLGAVALLASSAPDASTLLVALLVTNVSFMVMLLATRDLWSKDAARPARERVNHFALLRSAAPLGGSLLVAQVAPRVWILLLATVSGSEDVAVFSVAAAVVQTVLLVSVAAGAAYLPVLGRLAQGSPSDFRFVAGRLLDTMAMIGTAAAVGMALSAAGVMPVVFGDRLRGSATILVTLSLLPPMMLVSFTSRIILSAAGAGRADLIATLSGLGAGLLLAWILMPWLGLWAMVAGYVASEVTTGGLKLAALGRLSVINTSCVTSCVARCLPALLTAVAIGGALDRAGASLGAGIGAALCGVALYTSMLFSIPSIRSRGLRGLLP